jgi:hypothetical protein
MRKAWVTVALAPNLAIPAGPAAQGADLDPRISALLADVSEQRLADLLKVLQEFETRHTLSTQASATRGIGAAAGRRRHQPAMASESAARGSGDQDAVGRTSRSAVWSEACARF